jgi:hypothetical protein
MPYFNQSTQFFTDKAILAFTEGNIANISATVDNTYISFNNEGRKVVKEGLFVAEVGNVIRFLPRTKLTSVTSTSAATFTTSLYNIFVPGDVLYASAPYATLTITGSSATQTQTITIAGRTVTTTVTTSNVTTSASEVVAAINSAPYISDWVVAYNIAGVVYIFSKDGVTNYGITEGGTVTATLSGATLVVNPTAVGTISAIDYSTGTITLTGNAGIALPIGASIGVPVNKILGLHVHAVDYTLATAKSLALYTQASGVRTQFLPYFDGEIQATFPKMLFDVKF